MDDQANLEKDSSDQTALGSKSIPSRSQEEHVLLQEEGHYQEQVRATARQENQNHISQVQSESAPWAQLKGGRLVGLEQGGLQKPQHQYALF